MSSPAALPAHRVRATLGAALAAWWLASPLVAAPAGGQLLGVEIFPVRIKEPPPKPAEPETPEEEPAPAPEPEPPLKFAFFCFGPVFGNDSREIDPNYMPLPTATAEAGAPARIAVPVRYLRVPATLPGRTTWVGFDGSQISYHSRNNGRDDAREGMEANRGATAEAPAKREPALASRANPPKEPSVAELIAENRREMTRISWERAYRRFPELEREGSPEREAFESYLLKKHSDPRGGAAFDSPMWPEQAAGEFMAARNWERDEQASWDRVRAKVRIFNDPESVYTRRFMDFAASLREDPESAALFREPTWPEKALELHDRRFGPVPEQFR